MDSINKFVNTLYSKREAWKEDKRPVWKALETLPEQQRWPAFKSLVKSAGAYWSFAELASNEAQSVHHGLSTLRLHNCILTDKLCSDLKAQNLPPSLFKHLTANPSKLAILQAGIITLTEGMTTVQYHMVLSQLTRALVELGEDNLDFAMRLFATDGFGQTVPAPSHSAQIHFLTQFRALKLHIPLTTKNLKAAVYAAFIEKNKNIPVSILQREFKILGLSPDAIEHLEHEPQLQELPLIYHQFGQWTHASTSLQSLAWLIAQTGRQELIGLHIMLEEVFGAGGARAVIDKRMLSRGQTEITAIITVLGALTQQDDCPESLLRKILNYLASQKSESDMMRGVINLFYFIDTTNVDTLANMHQLTTEGLEVYIFKNEKRGAFGERLPTAVFTYRASLGKSNPRLMTRVDAFIDEVGSGKFFTNRYRTQHLQMIFKARPDLSAKWMKGASNDLTVREFLKAHLSPFDSTDLWQYFIEKKHTVQKELQAQYDAMVAKIKLSKDPKELGKKIGPLRVHLTLMKVASRKLSIAAKQLLGQIGQLPSTYTWKGKLRDALMSHSVIDTDNPIDLLLLGTETPSCQSVCSASTNRALLAYLLDGKNRLIAVKNKQGQIIARAIFRLLWDGKQPVLFLERIYGSDNGVHDLIRNMARQRAKAMNLPLLSDAITSFSYGPISSLSGPAPYEYVDALGGEYGSKWTISKSFVQWKP